MKKYATEALYVVTNVEFACI